MKTLKDVLAFLQKRSSKRGYTCDACGREVFDYPNKRLCAVCENTLFFNDKTTCDKCGRETVTQGLCLGCKSRPPVYTKGVSPLVYDGDTPALINRFKNGNVRLGYYLGELMAIAVMTKIPKDEKLFILSVPTTKQRLYERGFDQAQMLARVLFDVLKDNAYDVETVDFLQANDTPAQKHLTYAERLKSVQKRYRLQKRGSCKDKTFLLVDDILTSGATGNACATLLFQDGAKAVYFVAAASSMS